MIFWLLKRATFVNPLCHTPTFNESGNSSIAISDFVITDTPEPSGYALLHWGRDAALRRPLRPCLVRLDRGFWRRACCDRVGAWPLSTFDKSPSLFAWLLILLSFPIPMPWLVRRQYN
jgi:hypothetical protein